MAVVVAFDDPKAESDLSAYRAQYGISPCLTAGGCFRKLAQDGTSSYPAADANWAKEASLDLDMVSAICPNCRILLVEAKSTQALDLAAAENQAVAQGATEVSDSFLGEEAPEYAPAYDHPGVPITAAGGDGGYGAGVGSPASYPGVIAVGGTSLAPATGRRGWTDTVWGVAAPGPGTRSGCSPQPKPAWQSDSGCAGRTDNDVSAIGDPNTPVSVYDSYETPSPWLLLGGTSASAPIISAAMALTSPYTRSFRGARALYVQESLAIGGLNDVVSGLNGSCGGYLCEAKLGYDGPSGVGTLNGAPEVANPALLALGASSLTATGAVLKGTVNPHGGELQECRFEYGPAASGTYPNSAPCTTVPGPLASPVPVSGAITGLTASTGYRFRVLVTYRGGSAVSAEQTFTTTGSTPTVTTGAPTSVTASSVSLNAQVNPNGSPIEDCRFEYGTTPQYGSVAECSSAVGSGQVAVAVSASLTGLVANATYHYRVAATNTNGTSRGGDRTATMLPRPPSVHTGMASAITTSTATLTATVDASGAPLGLCEFEFDSSGTFIPCTTIPGNLQGPVAVSASVQGLHPGTVFRFRVLAANSGGTSYGDVQEFSSLPTGALEPIELGPPGGSTGHPQAAKLTSKTLIVGPAGRLSATVRCPPANPGCSGTLTLQSLTAGPAAGNRSSRPAVTFAVGSFRARRAGLGAARMRLLASARGMLARSHTLRARATVRTRYPSGRIVTWQTLVRLRPAR